MISLFLWASGIRLPDVHLSPSFLFFPTLAPFITAHRYSFQSSLNPLLFSSIITAFWLYYFFLGFLFQLSFKYITSFGVHECVVVLFLLHLPTANSRLIFLIIIQYDRMACHWLNEWDIFLCGWWYWGRYYNLLYLSLIPTDKASKQIWCITLVL